MRYYQKICNTFIRLYVEPNCTQCVCDVRDYPVKTCEELGGYSLPFSMRRRQCPKGYAVQYGAAFWDTQRERDSLAMAACVVTFTQLLLLTNKFWNYERERNDYSLRRLNAVRRSRRNRIERRTLARDVERAQPYISRRHVDGVTNA